MAPPQQPPWPPGGLTLIACLPRLAIVVGAIAGSWVCGAMFGFWGAIGGAFAGAAIGFALYVLSILSFVGAFALGMWIREGRQTATEFLWGRGASTPDDTDTDAG